MQHFSTPFLNFSDSPLRGRYLTFTPPPPLKKKEEGRMGVGREFRTMKFHTHHPEQHQFPIEQKPITIGLCMYVCKIYLTLVKNVIITKSSIYNTNLNRLQNLVFIILILTICKYSSVPNYRGEGVKLHFLETLPLIAFNNDPSLQDYENCTEHLPTPLTFTPSLYDFQASIPSVFFFVLHFY